MLETLEENYKGLVFVSGPTKSGKSKLAEYLISNQNTVIYIATSKARPNDKEWLNRIKIHRERRPECWKLVEYPLDICKTINMLSTDYSILIDSLGGLVEQHLNYSEGQWELFLKKIIETVSTKNKLIVMVSEEVGWGIVPSTRAGHKFRERLCQIAAVLSSHSTKRWLAFQGNAIDLDDVGIRIP